MIGFVWFGSHDLVELLQKILCELLFVQLHCSAWCSVKVGL